MTLARHEIAQGIQKWLTEWKHSKLAFGLITKAEAALIDSLINDVKAAAEQARLPWEDNPEIERVAALPPKWSEKRS